MQEQGVRHDDPEYLKAHNLLSAFQRQQAYHKQRQMQQQQLQVQQRQQQLNGSNTEAVAANGMNGTSYLFSLYIACRMACSLTRIHYRPQQFYSQRDKYQYTGCQRDRGSTACSPGRPSERRTWDRE